MTVYNDVRFLDAAVDSVLRQDVQDLELVIVDDGTGEAALFEALGRRDPRIRIIVNPVNIGTAAAANRGIDAARSDIIVRLDADDIAEPERVGRLVAALAEDSELGLVGSAVTLIDEADTVLRVQMMPETDLDIRWTILFHNPFYHSAVAFRRSLFETAGRYIASELVSQDHYLWFHMLPHGRAKNLAEPLTRYRENPRGLTATHLDRNPRSRTHRIRETLWQQIGLTYTLHDDSLARPISQFLRGATIPLAHRPAAYRSILTVLRAFLASLEHQVGSDNDRAAHGLRRRIIGRILAEPPDDLRQRLAVWRLCWKIDRSAALAGLAAGSRTASSRPAPP